MPITLPNLDDRRYADLVDEALTMIPICAPEWTNHNASDPGITLVELFAHLTEMLIYRLNRVTVENVVAFLNLIDAGVRTADEYRDRARLTEEVRKVVTELRSPYRAVTCDDYSGLVTRLFPQKVVRAFATTLDDRRSTDGTVVGFMAVFVVPVVRSSVLTRSDGKYTDHASDLRTPGKIPFQIVPGSNQYLYIGSESVFDAVSFSLNTTVLHHKLTFEYSTGGDEDASEPEGLAKWSKLKGPRLADLTSSLASSGLLAFAPPDDWRESTVNRVTMRWVRVSNEASAETLRTHQTVATAFQVAVQSVPRLAGDPARALLKEISSELENRRLLTARFRVAEASYRKIAIRDITLHLAQDALEAEVVKGAKEELSRFFHPLIGGRDGKGWPFGRSVYLSEIIERLAGLSGVDFVVAGEKPLMLIDSETGVVTTESSIIKIKPYELVDFRILDTRFDTKSAKHPHGLQEIHQNLEH